MNRRHIQEAKALQSKAIQRLKSLDADQLSPSDSFRFCTEATKLERTALGEPETIEEQRLTGTGGGTVHFSLETPCRPTENWRNGTMIACQRQEAHHYHKEIYKCRRSVS